ncbi:MAG: hypothetical protein EBS10_05455, partial [Acidimicrobiia bacterium]|nr:hypothetical protein [Acidimicrobiia bacterium]
MTAVVSGSPDLSALEDSLGHRFDDVALLRRALSHRSWVAEQPDAESNERLEFLGDAVLGFVIADLVFERFSDLAEGSLTDLRKAVVNQRALAEVARGVFQALVHVGQTRRHDYEHEADVEGDMRQDDAQGAELKLDPHIKGEQGHRHHDLGDHDRQIEDGFEERLATEACPMHAQSRQCAEHRGDERARKADHEAVHERGEDVPIREQLEIPIDGEARPNRVDAFLVEGEHEEDE